MTPQQRQQKYRIRHPDRCRASRRASYHRHKTEKISSAAWRIKNKERVKGFTRKNRLKNLTRYREIKRLSQSRRRANYRGTHTATDLQDIWEYQNAKCFYCEVPLLFVEDMEADHFIPVSLGGSNERWNITISCMNCNRRKHSKGPALFMRFELKWPVFWNEHDGITKVAY